MTERELTSEISSHVAEGSPLSTRNEETLVARLRELVAWRAQREEEIHDTFGLRKGEKDGTFARERKVFDTRYQQQKSKLETEYTTTKRTLEGRTTTARKTIEQQDRQSRDTSAAQQKATIEKARAIKENDIWEVEAIFEARKDEPKLNLAAARRAIEAPWIQVKAFEEQARVVLQRRRMRFDESSEESSEKAGKSDNDDVVVEEAAVEELVDDSMSLPSVRLEQLTEEIGQRLLAFQEQRLGESLVGGRPLGLFILVWLAATALCGFTLGWQGWIWLAVGTGVAALIVGVVGVLVYPRAVRESLVAYDEILRLRDEAENAKRKALAEAESAEQAATLALAEKRTEDLEQIEAEWQQAEMRSQANAFEQLKSARESYDQQENEINSMHERESVAIESQYVPRIEGLTETYENNRAKQDTEHERELAQIDRERAEAWSELVSQWTSASAELSESLSELKRQSNAMFPAWDEIHAGGEPIAQEPTGAPPALRWGSFEVALDALPGGLSDDPSLATAQNSFTLPAVISFPDCPALLIETHGAQRANGDGHPGGGARASAAALMRNVMLRYLATFPAGKVRFTILDPTGLGDNFSGFMHLADFDPLLIANRIWTEPAHIQQRLVDLTEHMEKVIQKYLRNEYASIHEYNAQAQEVAEPFHVLVIADFPTNFSEESLRRLTSIVTSGPRCGVHTILNLDTKQKLPSGFDLAALREQAETVRWREGRFFWVNETLGEFPLHLDEPPTDARFTELVKRFGSAAKVAGRVEVPFESMLPSKSQWWSKSSASGIEIAMGKSGATAWQEMKLGRGTSQHVLISGKTGSGKSTLLHVLITNLAAWYSPDEVQFYLVDFKKGVEFKAYAREGLPHVRVVAIETEREFGLSVLQRLDLELKERGELFRAKGVNDVASFRSAAPGEKLPRILLMIDEFQELFTEEDRIAHDAALLLDRLVRQGRAFGIHVLLGSQTLAGAFSLARSTIGQMAVRIALQCSEADAHLILSEENTAARHLNRPGEAIYNDSNGLLKGNHPFQVAWLSDNQRDACLEQVETLERNRQTDSTSREPMIVFEGNAPADLAENGPLAAALACHLKGENIQKPGEGAVAWIGAPVAIKGPTNVVFHRSAGSNLLVAGPSAESALGVLASSVIGLEATSQKSANSSEKNATEKSGKKACFVVLDGSRADSAEAGYWTRMAKRLPQVDLEVVPANQIGEAMTQIAAEVERRSREGDEGEPPLFLIVYHMARFRDLRPADDDFGFSMSSDKSPATPAQQFAEVSREGPVVGVHCLVWLDSFNNVSRWLPRQILRDFEMRVLFQMTASDSTNLIDSPAAGQLGPHRGLLYLDETGSMEKFRPYHAPEEAWLDQVSNFTVQSRIAARK